MVNILKSLTNRIDIKSLTAIELKAWLKARGMRSFRAGQILRWIYQRQADSFEQMTDLRKEIRAQLDDHFTIARLGTVGAETSADGSQKFLFRLSDGETIETVLIPERNHYTLCISSQVGCALGCRFCLTARSGLVRNLSRAEIVSQVRDVQHRMDRPRLLTNIVLMGMGEPLANYANVTSALDTILDGEAGMVFASRRVTLSTAGLVPRLSDLGRDAPVNLAVSLNATDNRTRSRLMPINRKYPIEALIDACRRYPLRSGRRITFEYILIKGVNDRPRHARQLSKLLSGLKAKVNLIPFNPHQGSRLEPPAAAVVDAFQEVLLSSHLTAIVRQSKGGDISAACGQLKARSRGAATMGG